MEYGSGVLSFDWCQYLLLQNRADVLYETRTTQGEEAGSDDEDHQWDNSNNVDSHDITDLGKVVKMKAELSQIKHNFK